MEGKQNFRKFPRPSGTESDRRLFSSQTFILRSAKLQQQTSAAVNYGAPLFPPLPLFAWLSDPTEEAVGGRDPRVWTKSLRV